MADELAELRAARRSAVRSAALSKTEGGAPFGLLVIPVDFADARFSAPPDLTERLVGEAPGSLRHYFGTASQQRTRIEVVQTPVVSLSGDRLDYSDLGLQGYSRTRAMAREALTAAAAMAVDFADADADGDGEVDGVLLLHAAPGLENDPEGLIVPLQYFLAEAVVQGGVVARMYAVGAAGSALGLWAHETGHLLGLNDRYDLHLPAGGETDPRGGLGRFSLMAVGWQGSGDGTDPALPDAYSRLQLGWADLATTLDSGVVRLRGEGDDDAQVYHLAETRGRDAAAPYDAGIPADRAVLYRIREDLAEGEVDPDDPARNQRVQLVEADGRLDVTQGLSDGDVTDLFPSDGVSQTFTGGSGVEATFTVDGGAVVLENPGGAPQAWFSVTFPDAGTSGPVTVSARVATRPELPDSLLVSIDLVAPAWGTFSDGTLGTDVWLHHDADGGWANYAARQAPVWVATGTPPDGAVSRCVVTSPSVIGVAADDYPWDHEHQALALDADWGDHWSVTGDALAHPWQRWTAVPGWETASLPVITCLPAGADAGDWPDVSYGNGVQTSLTSEPLGVGVRWVRFTHALDLELLYPGEAVDAATMVWESFAGETVAAEPVDGWPGRCSPRAGHGWAGAPSFAWSDSLRAGDRPLWRREVVAVPDPALHGPGPWRLRFVLSTSAVWRGRGWFVTAVEAGVGAVPTSAFAVAADAGRLSWSAPVGTVPLAYEVQGRPDDASPWMVLASLPADSASVALAELDLTAGALNRLRVVALTPAAVASRAVLVAQAGVEPALDPPRPNPACGSVALAFDAAVDEGATLTLYDLRGRKLRRWRPGGGRGAVTWDGRDGAGKRVAAGVYIVRLEAQGRTRTAKLTWMH